VRYKAGVLCEILATFLCHFDRNHRRIFFRANKFSDSPFLSRKLFRLRAQVALKRRIEPSTHSSRFKPRRRKSWHCVQLKKPDRNYQLRVSIKDAKFSAPSCYLPVKADSWVEVRNGKQGASSITCIGRKDKEEPVTAKVALIAENEGAFVIGKAILDGPIAGANVQIVDRQGNPVSTEVALTDKHGVFIARAPNMPADGLRIEVRGGKDGAGPVSGKLAAVIPSSYDFERKPVAINVVTTILAEAADRRPNADLDDLTNQIKNFLGIPETADIGSSLNNPYQKLVSMKSLAAHARAAASIDDFARNVVSAIEKGESLNVTYQIDTDRPPKLQAGGIPEWLAD